MAAKILIRANLPVNSLESMGREFLRSFSVAPISILANWVRKHANSLTVFGLLNQSVRGKMCFWGLDKAFTARRLTRSFALQPGKSRSFDCALRAPRRMTNLSRTLSFLDEESVALRRETLRLDAVSMQRH